MLSFGSHLEEPGRDAGADAAALTYEPVDVRMRNRQRLKAITWRVFWVALGVLLVATTWRYGKQAQYLCWQRQCMRYVLPPDTIVYDGKPTQAASAPPGAQHVLESRSANYLFMHERERPDGTKLLVTVYADHTQGITPAAIAYRPATFAPRSTTERLYLQESGGPSLPTGAKIYAGQPDPKDPTHFTIDFEEDGRRDTIDGWVTDRGIVLEVRRHPF